MTAPPSTLTRRRRALATNAMRRPSGDSAGPLAPTVPSIRRGVPSSRRLTNKYGMPPRRPTNATVPPDGDTDTAVRFTSASGTSGGGVISKTVSGCAGVGRGQTAHAPETITAPAAAATSSPARDFVFAAGRATAGGALAAGSPRTTRASPMSRSRSRGSRSRQRATSWRTVDGVAGGSAPRSGGCVSTAASVSLIVSPSNSRRPVSISHRTTPNAQMSARLSTARPRACSGAM